MTQREPILDPTGQSQAAGATMLAPRPRELRGVRIGLLDNTKPNARLLLQTVADQLRAAHGTGDAVMFTKSYFGTPVEEDLADQVAAECDVVVAGVGD